MFKYFDINREGHSIRCKLYCNDQRSIGALVIFGHGFGGHKDNKAAERFALTLLSKRKDAGVLVFNWPCHGDDVKKKLTLTDCLTYLRLVLDYSRETWAPAHLWGHATSFGGYLFLKYIAQNGCPFEKVVLRCPAIHMYGVMTSSLVDEKAREALGRGRAVPVGFDRKISVESAFLRELQAGDLTGVSFLDWAESLLILHGTKDEIIPIDTVAAFADENCIEFIPVANADHRFTDPAAMGNAIRDTIAFFVG